MRPLYRAKTITIKLDNFKHFAETITSCLNKAQ